MATLTIPKGWADGDILLASDLTAFKTAVETFINTTKLNDDNIQAQGITGSTKLAAASVNAAKLATNAITTAKIVDEAVTAAKITDLNVTTAKIADEAVTRAKLYDLTLTEDDYSDTSTSTSETEISSLSITTNGRPVFLTCKQNLSSDSSSFLSSVTTTATTMQVDIKIRLYRGATMILETRMQYYDEQPDGTNATFTMSIPNGAIWMIDQPAAGTYTYSLKTVNGASGVSKVAVGKLMAVEM